MLYEILYIFMIILRLIKNFDGIFYLLLIFLLDSVIAESQKTRGFDFNFYLKHLNHLIKVLLGILQSSRLVCVEAKL